LIEVACGPGRFWPVAGATPNRFYVGVDRSITMLKRFRAEHPTACLVVADARRLPFADGSFDAGLCIRFLSHLRGEFRRAVLRELRRVNCGGVVLDARHPYNLRTLSRWIRWRLGLAPARKLRWTRTVLAAELAAAGLLMREFKSIAWGLSARVLLRTDVAASFCRGTNEHPS
jgi:ubiquinone/menaquinone biosynthesis C-methylase UbiE